MPVVSISPLRTWSLAITTATALTIASGSATLVAQGSSPHEVSVPSIPTPNTGGLVRPGAPPSLPPGADAVPETTLEVVVGSEGARAEQLTQVVSRSRERVHLAGERGREWLFERNPVDTRRAGAFLIDHASKSIVTYGESDLRMLLGMRGWADVLSLGFETERLEQYARTDQRRSVGSIQFTRFVEPGAGSPAPGVWWSEEHLVALDFATASQNHARTRFRIASARSGVTRSLLELPHLRFPDYRVIHVADWLEHR